MARAARVASNVSQVAGSFAFAFRRLRGLMGTLSHISLRVFHTSRHATQRGRSFNSAGMPSESVVSTAGLVSGSE